MSYNYYNNCAAIQDSNDLVEKHLRYVIKLAHTYRNSGKSLDEIISAGNVGLMKAAEKYDETRGASFMTYATPWIKKYMYQEVVDKAVKVPYQHQMNLQKVNKFINEYKKSNDTIPSIETISKYTKMSQRKINGILKHNVSSNFTVSCDQSAFDDGDLNSQLGYIERTKVDTDETTTDVFEMLAKSDDREALYKAIDNLKSEYKELVKMRFFNGMGVSEIAKHYNQSPSNITVKIDNMLKALKNEFLKVA